MKRSIRNFSLQIFKEELRKIDWTVALVTKVITDLLKAKTKRTGTVDSWTVYRKQRNRCIRLNKADRRNWNISKMEVFEKEKDGKKMWAHMKKKLDR